MKLSVKVTVLVAIVTLSVVPVAAAAASSESFHPDQRLSKGWFGVLTYKFVRDEIPGGAAALSECDQSNKFDDLGGESQFKRDALNCLADMGYFDEVPVPSGSATQGRLFHPDQRLSKGWFGVLTYKFVRNEIRGGRAALRGCASTDRFSDLSSESSFKQDALNCLAGLGYFDQVPLPDGSLPGWRTASSSDDQPPTSTARDADGVYATDPLHLIAYASFERAYSLPGADGDILEVWLCNTPESGRRYSTHEDNRHNPSNYADKFASQVTAWFEWLSDDMYAPVFRPGGVVDVNRSADFFEACDEKVLNQNLRRWRDVHGVVVVVGVAADSEGFIGRASCGFFSQRSFPDNRRSILVSGDAFTDPTLLAHEMGHALCWPHSYSGETKDDYGEVYEYDNPMDIMGSPSYGEADPVPMIGTLAINRYASGWIPIDQVRIHRLGTTARYELVPPGENGVQLLVIPYEIPFENASRLSYLALGARVAGSGDEWWADAGLSLEGVEIYEIDQTAFACELPDRGYCYGLERRTIPVFDPDIGYDWQAPPHVMVETGEWWYWGEAGESDSFIVELVAVDGHTFTVAVRPLIEEPEPAVLSDWDVGTGSRTAGDYTSASTLTNIGSEDIPNWLQLFVRCTGRDELDIYIGSSGSYFASTPTLQYRFGGQSSPTELSLTASTDNRFGFIQEDDLSSFVRQLRADTSGRLYVDLWDVPTYSGRSAHEGGGALGIAGVASHVEPILQECGY